jgi:hypothetical protein
MYLPTLSTPAKNKKRNKPANKSKKAVCTLKADTKKQTEEQKGKKVERD